MMMGIIRIPLRFEGSIGEKIVYALFDSGATYSCLSEEIACCIEKTVKLRRPLEIATASSSHFVVIEEAMRADFYHEDIRLSDEFMVVPGLSEEAIIGVNTLQKWRMKLDFEQDKVIINPKVAEYILKDLKEPRIKVPYDKT
jgi:predicted aspartyl protease